MNTVSNVREPGETRIPNVFIGSSSEGLEIAQYIQAALQRGNMIDATIWDQAFFPLSSVTLEGLATGARDFDFAVMVITPDGERSVRQKKAVVAPENVLFEIGLFVGTLGRERTFVVMCEQDRVELPSDLAGATIAKYSRPRDLSGHRNS